MKPIHSILDEKFWTNLYATEQTRWDTGSPTPALKEYIDQLTDTSLKILIPGCGNAYEAAYLLQKGFAHLTLIDISELLVEKLKSKFSGKPVNILHQDFFLHTGKYDLILEQTFFCALHPDQRKDYVIKMKELLNDNGKLAGVLFNTEFDGGPPFGGSVEEYQDLFTPHFSSVKISPCYNSVEPRKGNEVFIIIEK